MAHITKLSIVVPVFNEERTIVAVLKKLNTLSLPQNTPYEIIVVDDGSTDTTPELISQAKRTHKKIRYIQHETNKGKGAAVIIGIRESSGDYIIIQDADLEYNPDDISRLIVPVLDQGKEVVYGTRLNRLPHLDNEEKRTRFLVHYIGNRFLSLVTSVLYGQWITDMETCYKLFPKKATAHMKLYARGFEFEPEITAKLIKAGHTIYEVPITTKPRGYEEGKKLNTVRDGIRALSALIKYRFIS